MEAFACPGLHERTELVPGNQIVNCQARALVGNCSACAQQVPDHKLDDRFVIHDIGIWFRVKSCINFCF